MNEIPNDRMNEEARSPNWLTHLSRIRCMRLGVRDPLNELDDAGLPASIQDAFIADDHPITPGRIEFLRGVSANFGSPHKSHTFARPADERVSSFAHSDFIRIWVFQDSSFSRWVTLLHCALSFPP